MQLVKESFPVSSKQTDEADQKGCSCSVLRWLQAGSHFCFIPRNVLDQLKDLAYHIASILYSEVACQTSSGC